MKSLKLFPFVSFCIFANLISFAQEDRNLLVTDINDRKFVDHVLTMDNSWIKYPAYYDRLSWSTIPEGIKKSNIEAGERYLEYKWPDLTATMYLDFIRTGNRDAIDKPNSERRRALRSLVMAELMEGKGRFLDDIINGVFILCEQTYWGSSAHFYLNGYDHTSKSGSISKPYTVLPDNDNRIIDLYVAEMAADLAWIWYFFHEEFDKTSPIISSRLKQELHNKVLNPYYTRNDFWWITGWGPGDNIYEVSRWTMNNWSTWISYNLLNVILLMEDNPDKKNDGVFKTMSTLNHFINMYPLDGACDEGPSYWRHAGGKLFEYLVLLRNSTNGMIDIFDQEVIRNMGRYIYRAYISKGKHYINFSNANPEISHDGGHILRFGRAINDPVMQEFGAFLLDEINFGEKAVIGSKLADKFIRELPADYVPYWDFNAPGTPNEEKDTSAGAIFASALLDISELVANPSDKKRYRDIGNKILLSLAVNYLSDGSDVAVLWHAVGDKPLNREIDMPIIYADYYFVEALMREIRIRENLSQLLLQ